MHAGSPANKLVNTGDRNLHGIIETGDIITGLNGAPIRSVIGLQEQLRASADEATITIKDVNTGNGVDWYVKPVSVEVPVAPPITPNPTSGSKAHVILACLTDDPSIGRFIQVSLPALKSLVENQIRTERLGSLKVLSGPDCNAAKIQDAISDLSITPNDSICFIYLGHGAFDPNHAQNDPAGGHFLQLPDGALLRKTLLHSLSAKRPRLLSVISDCCNVRASAIVPTRQVAETRVMTITGWTRLEELLFCYRGTVDLTASSRGQYSWFSSDIGGWFTKVVLDTFPEKSTTNEWDGVWTLLTQRADNLYVSRRSTILMEPSIPPLIRQQLTDQQHMVPMAFQFDVKREDPTDTPTKPREFVQVVTKLVE